MLHSAVTSRGQTTSPGEIRKALQIKPGDKLEDMISGVEIHLDALHRHQKTRVHFVDCLIAATSTAQDIPVATFDELSENLPTCG
jgi:bifunctional DNA-binding transcriptional regulator/antitoxin component of YhaV-PrlF toxin-antitoxin module